jgi:hypothetical protein
MTGFVAKGNAFLVTSDPTKVVQSVWRNAHNMPWLDAASVSASNAATWFGSSLNDVQLSHIDTMSPLTREYSASEQSPTITGHLFHHLPNRTNSGLFPGPYHGAILLDLDGLPRDPNHIVAGPYAFDNTRM